MAGKIDVTHLDQSVLIRRRDQRPWRGFRIDTRRCPNHLRISLYGQTATINLWGDRSAGEKSQETLARSRLVLRNPSRALPGRSRPDQHLTLSGTTALGTSQTFIKWID
ncbi:hypothetical protein Y032_0293g1603 [Ancylostoma ceylanicum]|uniref:Uncharacterized protein n=1 Tax=Ancylostoma ceylanicum TaxID=53326 RepID=A0A016S4U0_9BILA|nr:hypothetical protein Y032_0293g1603 [Ancylostoma ceylanicum]